MLYTYDLKLYNVQLSNTQLPEQVLLPFSRDTYVLEHFKHSSSSPSKSFIRGKLSIPGFDVIYPPNGVIPFHGFTMYG